MTTAQEFTENLQSQTLDAVVKAQDIVVETVTAWAESAQRVAAKVPDFTEGNPFLGYADFAKQFPTASQVIDVNFDFAQQILTNQRDFAHRLFQATKVN